MLSNRVSRRTVLKRSAVVSAFCIGGSLCCAPWSRAIGANDDLRVGFIGLGSKTKSGGMGRKTMEAFRQIPGVRVVALCDVDSVNMGLAAEDCANHRERVVVYRDARKLLEDKEVDAVVISTPNHWHGLMTIWACQAGKDVFLQKPASHNIFEGRKMVEAARQRHRIVQCSNASRLSNACKVIMDYLSEGHLGKVVAIRGIRYAARSSIGKINHPQPIPTCIDYDLWSGPAPLAPLSRKNLHYDWHWQWPYGNGEMGNWGIHILDGCRTIVGGGLPQYVFSVAGRFGYDDDGQTANTQIVYFDYPSSPVSLEIRGLPKDKSYLKNAVPDRDYWGENAMDTYKDISNGIILQCENGYVINPITGAPIVFDQKGNKLKRLKTARQDLGQNFFEVMRSRCVENLQADILEGHLSAILVHMGNISHQVGKLAPDHEMRGHLHNNKHMREAYQRFKTHLAANGVDLDRTPATLGTVLSIDPKSERFIGEFSNAANQFISRQYRPPFTLPHIV